MANKSLGFIGGGRITKIFLQAFKNDGKEFDNIFVFDPDLEALKKLKNRFSNIIIENNCIEKPSGCDIVFLSIHPPVIMEALSKIAPYLKSNAVVVSLAPKITILKIKNALNGFASIARVNPSANGIINQGFNPVAFSDSINESNKECLLSLLKILGPAPVVEENKLEGYAVIGAMGPTYFWFQIDHLKKLGISYCLNEKEAEETISEMIKGTVNTLFNSKMTPEEVMDLVPVKPIGDYEDTIKSFYSEKLNAIYNRIKP